MAAITKRLLHLRPNPHSYPRLGPYPFYHFSSSSDPEPPADISQSEAVQEPDSSAPTKTKSSFLESFDDVKASLQREPTSQNSQQAFSKPLSFSNRTTQTARPSKAASLEEIRRNISEFRQRSAAPPPSSSTDQYVSMQELYKRNVLSMTDGSATPSDSFTGKPSVGLTAGGKFSYNAIRESLSHLKPNRNDSGGNPVDRMSLARFEESLKLKPDPNANNQGSTRIIGGSDSSPPNFVGKEKRRKGNFILGSSGSMLPGFMQMHDHLDMGKKLKMLRPDKRKGKWFSLQELSERLAKLREIDEKESVEKMGVTVKDIRDGIKNIGADLKPRRSVMQRIDVLGQLGGTPSFMLSPPKENLVEKYFHPDNMSSAEKLKLELTRVRDEFKMSESDCGSARVQVAQLTTKIKHLSNVLQKKDKHSRKGLQAMVQRRKKLLKYLRRTDWDSYCLVISKLGLRDNPDVKA